MLIHGLITEKKSEKHAIQNRWSFVKGSEISPLVAQLSLHFFGAISKGR